MKQSKQKKIEKKFNKKTVILALIVTAIFFASWNLGITLTNLVYLSDSVKSEAKENIIDAVDQVDVDIEDSVISELLNIVGIYDTVEKDGYNQQSILLKANGVLDDNTFNSYDKRMLVYYYALNNGKAEAYDSNVSVVCSDIGKCDGIQIDTFNGILKKYNMTVTGESLFNQYYKYDNHYLYNLIGIYDTNELKHSLSLERNGNTLDLIDDLTIINLETNEVVIKNVKYSFRNNNSELYLYSVNVN